MNTETLQTSANPTAHGTAAGAALAAVREGELRNLPIDWLHESPTNPRQNFGRLEELAGSIRLQGLIQPLVVRPDGDGHEIVAGARRFRAAKLAGLAEVPCLVRPMSDAEVLEVQIVENLQREDIHPLEEASGYQTLIERAGLDVAAIAARIGKSQSYVYQRLKLADLVPEVRQAFLERKLTPGHAILVARLQPADQLRALRELLNEPFSVRVLAEWIDREVYLDLHSAPFPKDDELLVGSAGACATCPKRTGNQPKLWPDVKKKDTCTDPACFNAKLEAHIEAKLAAAKLDGETLVSLNNRIPDRREKPKPGTLDRDSFVVIEHAKERCEHAQRGIVVAGYQRGEVLTVCAEPKCRQHGLVAADLRHLEKRRKEETELKQRRAARAAVIDAILAKAPAQLARADLVLIGAAFFERLTYESKKAIYDRHGWKLERKAGRYDWGVPFMLEEMKEAELSRFLVELSLIEHLEIWPYTPKETPDALKRAAARYKVDIEAIEARAADKSRRPGGRKGGAR